VDELWLALRVLVLLTIANNAPIAAKLLFGSRWDHPVDNGLLLVDGRPLLGASKTWRGVIAAVLLSGLLAPALGFAPAMGALIGALAMAGDMLASFTKRRLGIPSSGKSFGLDQLPEALLPLLPTREALGLSWLLVAAVTLAFVVLERPAARLSHLVGWRDTPY
jgi:CDP-2,3-bis-(O-geranylgeranyl)-sn-glycerol synthase